jgi:hypothetical protein
MICFKTEYLSEIGSESCPMAVLEVGGSEALDPGATVLKSAKRHCLWPMLNYE